jgi:hypothetical protein
MIRKLNEPNISVEGLQGILSRAGKPILEVTRLRKPKPGLFVVHGISLASLEVIGCLREKNEWTLTWNQRKWKFEATLEDVELHTRDRVLGISLIIHDTPKTMRRWKPTQ